MESICFLAQFPPPIHGLSKAVDTLYNSHLKGKYSFSKIDIKDNRRIFHTLWKLLTTRAEVVYFTIAQTRLGNLRDLFLMKIISMRGKKCIVHLHGGYYRILINEGMKAWQRRLNMKAMQKIDSVIVLGNSLRWIFEGLVQDERIYTVNNCVDDEFINKSICDKCIYINKTDTIHVLYLSNFIQTKGYREVLECAKQICGKNENNKFFFHFAGKFFNSVEESYFFSFIQDNELTNVIYHGVVAGKEKVNLLALCHVFILMTRYPNEGQPISILEAMGNGMAVITTNHAGISDIATDENGYICDKGNISVDEIVRCLQKWYINREEMLTICRRNYEKVLRHFTEDKYIENMDKVFQQV